MRTQRIPDSLVCKSIKPFNAHFEELNTVLDDMEIEKLEKKICFHTHLRQLGKMLDGNWFAEKSLNIQLN